MSDRPMSDRPMSERPRTDFIWLCEKSLFRSSKYQSPIKSLFYDFVRKTFVNSIRQLCRPCNVIFGRNFLNSNSAPHNFRSTL
jgi:hypothetical protein